jgi:photosystem II stability/assembly factor-like uncharacterized protein
VSEDGGKSFKELLPYSGVHPDHHAWWINPENPNMIIDGNDGGLNISRDMGKTWVFADNIPVGQFYHINVDMAHPYNVYGGMQDNGSWVGPAYVWRNGGIRNSYWQEVLFGDGFDAAPDPDNNRYGYAMSQGGNLARFDLQTGFAKNLRPTHPNPDMKLRYNWNSALAQDPFNTATIYYGSQFVHKSTNKGDTWEIISPDLTTDDKSKQKQHDSGGMTMDATGAENHCTILTIAPSKVKQGVIWAGTDDGQVQVTQDGGKSWTNTTAKIVGMPKNAWVAQIQPSTYNAGEAFVVVNNYRMFDYKPYLFHTKDFGATWVSIVTGAQVGESNYTLSVVQDPVEPKLMFLGTENGLFVSIDGAKNWTKWTNGYPAGVPTIDMVIHPREHDLVIGTFGRAIYVFDDIRPLREMAKSTNVMTKTAHIFTPPDAYLVSIQQPSGPRFDANAVYNGDNREPGAMITYSVNKPAAVEASKPAEDSKAKKGKEETKPAAPAPTKSTVKYDSVKLEVYNDKGVLINTLRQKAPEENGVYRMRWMMNEKGERQPTREQRGGGGGGGFGGFGGTSVLPGIYKLRFLYGDQKDSTQITVKADPRLDVAPSVYADRYNMLKDLQKLRATAATAADRLRESKEIVEEYEKKMKDAKRNDLKEAMDKTKAMKDSIEAVLDFMFGKVDKRQGIVRSPDPTPISYIQTAQGYVGRSQDPISDTDKRVYQHAVDKMATLTKRVNDFYETQWKPYRAMMEKVNLSPFKDYEPIK